MEFLIKLKIELLHDPIIPLLSIYTGKTIIKKKKTCDRVEREVGGDPDGEYM